MAAKKKPAGIRPLVYGIGKGKAGIEGLSVSMSPEFNAIKRNKGLRLHYFHSALGPF
jgi:hypothetical protein